MSLITILDQARRKPLDARYTYLLQAKKQFKPHSIDMKHLQDQIDSVMYRRIRRDARKKES